MARTFKYGFEMGFAEEFVWRTGGDEHLGGGGCWKERDSVVVVMLFRAG